MDDYVYKIELKIAENYICQTSKCTVMSMFTSSTLNKNISGHIVTFIFLFKIHITVIPDCLAVRK